MEKTNKKTEIENPTPEAGPLDLTKRVELVATDKAPYHKKGEKVSVSPAVAKKMKANGWAE